MDQRKYSGFSSTTMQILGIFRLLLATILAALYLISKRLIPTDEGLSQTFYIIFTLYLLFLLLSYLFLKRPRFQTMQAIRIFAIVDLAYLSVLCFITDGLDSPLIIMMLISIMAHGAFLPIWQALSLVAIAVLFQGYLWIDSNRYFNYYSFIEYLKNQDLIRILTQSLIAVVAVVITNVWLRKYEASEKIITQQNEELHNASVLHEIVIQQANSGIIVVDHRGNILLINEYIRIWFGGNIVTNMPLKLYSKTIYERYLLWKDLTFNNKKPIHHQEEEFYVDFKQIRTHNLEYTLINIEETDLANQRAQQNKLAALGQLTAAIAHELRNPMTSVFQAAQLLNEKEEKTPMESRLFEMIINNINRANRIISEVLMIARKDDPTLERIELATWSEELMHEFNLTHAEFKECLTIDIDEGFKWVYFDRNHFHQVVCNLINNATIHSKMPPESLKITLAFEQIAGNPTLTIYDNGVGVSKKNQTHLFEPFFTTDVKGTGLGLFLVKEICEINQAHIDYVSNSAKGSGFRLIFSSPM